MGFALPVLGGLAIGAAGAGMSAMAANRQRQQMQSQQQQIMMQQMMSQQAMNQQAMAQQQQQQQQMQLRMEEDAANARLTAMQNKQAVGPDMGTEPKNLASILTSPLGDPSEPNLGRKKLLSPPPKMGVK